MDFRRLDEAIEALKLAHARMARIVALQKMSKKDNPYYPLVRVMCKLQLIKGWPIY